MISKIQNLTSDTKHACLTLWKEFVGGNIYIERETEEVGAKKYKGKREENQWF